MLYEEREVLLRQLDALQAKLEDAEKSRDEALRMRDHFMQVAGNAAIEAHLPDTTPKMLDWINRALCLWSGDHIEPQTIEEVGTCRFCGLDTSFTRCTGWPKKQAGNVLSVTKDERI